MECSICGISDKMRNVSRALSSKGIVFACDNCAKNEGLILMKKPVVETENRESVYERMARLAGVSPKPQQERPWLKPQEKDLKKIVDKNYEKKMAARAILLKSRLDLVENFHWIIMRVRRVQGLTQEQLAKRINEPEAAVKMAEQGVIPEGYTLIDKLERFLKIRLVRQRNLSLPLQKQQLHLTRELHSNTQTPKPMEAPLAYQATLKEATQTHGGTFPFDKQSANSLTIADLKRMRSEEEGTRPSYTELKKEREKPGSDVELKEKARLAETEETAEEELDRKEHQSLRPYDRLDYE